MRDLKPVIRFLTNTPEQQILHVLSEVNEILDAHQKAKAPRLGCDVGQLRMDLIDEITDTHTALATLTEILRFTPEEVGASRERVERKNRSREYYVNG